MSKIAQIEFTIIPKHFGTIKKKKQKKKPMIACINAYVNSDLKKDSP